MLKEYRLEFRHQGFSMIEVLITIVILAFGLLGLAAFQLRIQSAELESFQRAQALVLLSDMVERITVNRSNAASYISSSIGTGDSQPSSCTSLTAGSAARDLCEWSNALKGSSEVSGSVKLGAMINARGCITQVQAPDSTSGVCKPGIYRVDVVWQGASATVAPSITCGSGQYGTNDAYRRAISTSVTVALLSCT